MSENYDVHAIIEDLKNKEEMNADQHDGCYELMRETVKAYSNRGDLSALNYKDLNLIYLTTVGTWSQGIDAKKNMIDESNLPSVEKKRLKKLWDETWEKAGRGEYSNNEASAKGGQSIGLFGTGFFTFRRRNSEPASEQVQNFVQMLIDILPMTDDDTMFNRVEIVLKDQIPGMQTAAVSMILHCLKPYTFPVLNANTGCKNIFGIIGVPLDKAGSLSTYIDNCRKIKVFRDQNFSCKNYRIFDIEAQKMDTFASEKMAWLLTWNIENWTWAGYAEKCEQTKSGGVVIESWTCSNTNPKNGDEVFLIKLGELPRGIIGHGTVVKESYEGVHFDLVKAAEGKTTRKIDVAFDRLINFNKEKYITQEELNSKCAAQHWSPQNSGIKIKQEVLPELHRLWQSTIADSKNIQEKGIHPQDWWPGLEEYNPGITAETYHDLFLDEKVVHRKWLTALYEMYQMPGHLGTCKQLGLKYGHKSAHYISYFSTVGGKIIKATGCPVLPEKEKASRCWPVLFQGRTPDDKLQGSYYWKMRTPVVEAMEKLIQEGTFESEGKETMEHFYHNLILYGPPGTGKTYNSIIYAVALCEGKPVNEVKKAPYSEILLRYNSLKKAGRVVFTTFHQSYGYEEFIEGIKPKLDEESDKLEYTIEDGLFKDFCNRAKTVKVQVSAGAQVKPQPRIWGMLLGGTGMTELKKQCFEKGKIRLGWAEVKDEDVDSDFAGDANVSWNAKHMVLDFKNTMEIGDVVVIEKNNKSIDAIGVITGDYVYDESQSRYPRSRSVEWLVKNIDKDIVPFLPNGRKQLSRFSVFAFDYIGIDTIIQIVNEYGNDSVVEANQETKPYVFIIDEINRGNISKIFGELITLIEDKKRAGAEEAMEAILPYSGESFSVPQNVYILGTMNTADRSIALMDTALRRRFDFEEMMPDSGVLKELGIETIEIDGVKLNIVKMLDTINERIEYLFDREHTIGHAFFVKLVDDPSLDTLSRIFRKKVVPLLQEYFFEDYEKIQLVLGDNTKEDEYKFILDVPVKVKDIFNGNPDVDLPEKGYRIQASAFNKIQSYKLIGRDL